VEKHSSPSEKTVIPWCSYTESISFSRFRL